MKLYITLISIICIFSLTSCIKKDVNASAKVIQKSIQESMAENIIENNHDFTEEPVLNEDILSIYALSHDGIWNESLQTLKLMNFDYDSFSNLQKKELDKIRKLVVIGKLKDTPDLGFLENLTALDIVVEKPIDVVGLNIPKIIVLNLSENQISDISPLVCYPDLEHLALNSTNVQELPDMSAFPSLRSLQLNNVSSISLKNIDTISNPFGLQLFDVPIIHDFEMLGKSKIDVLYMSEDIFLKNKTAYKKTIEKIKEANPRFTVMFFMAYE